MYYNTFSKKGVEDKTFHNIHKMHNTYCSLSNSFQPYQHHSSISIRRALEIGVFKVHLNDSIVSGTMDDGWMFDGAQPEVSVTVGAQMFSLDEDTSGNNSSLVMNPSLHELYAIYRPSIAFIDRYVTLVWYVIGFPGNLLALVVWIQPSMRHSSGCYLAALAAADFLFLLLQLCFELQWAWNVTTLKVPVLCEVFPVFFLATQYIGPLLVLGFTIERYISVCHPFQRERYCKTRRAMTVIASLVTVCLTMHVVQAYFWTYDPQNEDCSVRQEVTVNDAGSVWSIWSWVTELLVFGLVPLAILLLNLLVIAEARKLSANETRMLSCQQVKFKSSPSRTPFAPSTTTVMLLAVSFYLIATTLPATISYAIYLSFPTGNMTLAETGGVADDVTWQRHFTYWMARTVVQEVCMSHYAGNFYIYLLTGAMFRAELRRIIWRLGVALGLRGKRGGRGRAVEARHSTLGILDKEEDRWRNGVSRVFFQNDLTENSCVGIASSPVGLTTEN